VLFPQRLWAGLADGTVTLAFRRWRRPAARAGSVHQTPAGLLRIEAVEPVAERDITEADACRAGFADLAALLAEQQRYARDGELYRIELRPAGADPRLALRERAELGEEELAGVLSRLARMDARSQHGPWTAVTLRLIAERPATRAADLAAELGRVRLPFKADVRKLKALGLTESLEVGYRLSPRGRTVVDHLE
jgi:hypothetical protein